MKKGLRGSRMAGDFFRVNGQLYRPSQDCLEHYGAGTVIWCVDSVSLDRYEETEVAVYILSREATILMACILLTFRTTGV